MKEFLHELIIIGTSVGTLICREIIVLCKIVKVSATKLFFYSNIRLVKDNLVFFWVFGLKTI
ncbi:hypothetical protein SHM_11070 [Spiroplasma ixodetis]|uniref:Uncharacterized protein n=1 Tax=Spiroplasma ixodetis TaxID=2141 RepID=A0ABN6T0G8_9MOLU|nr:hypothetical protein SHM_11070 [Spiroplasma ixodetis]